MAMSMQLVFLSLVGSVTASDVFKLVHSSVQLDLQKTYKLSTDGTVRWLFNTSIGIAQYNGDSPSKVFQKYQGRVESNEKTHSLTLKNLQKSDSGLYEAEIFDETREIVTKYHLYVLDPVEKPVLTVYKQKSNATCFATFACKTQYFSVTFSCYSDPCYNTTEKESGNTLLSLDVRNGTIVCNHSNPVSSETTEEIKHVKQLCFSEGDKDMVPGSFSYKPLVIPVAIACLITGLIIIIIIIYIRHKKYSRTEPQSTVYEEVKGGNNAQTIEMSSPGTVYCTVGKPAEPGINDESRVSTSYPGNKEVDPRRLNNSSSQDDNLNTKQEAGTNEAPQTIYATVNKCGKPV